MRLSTYERIKNDDSLSIYDFHRKLKDAYPNGNVLELILSFEFRIFKSSISGCTIDIYEMVRELIKFVDEVDYLYSNSIGLGGELKAICVVGLFDLLFYDGNLFKDQNHIADELGLIIYMNSGGLIDNSEIYISLYNFLQRGYEKSEFKPSLQGFTLMNKMNPMYAREFIKEKVYYYYSLEGYGPF